ncbi:hypothetical protein H8959_007554 [Pygathrix nigripes]
MGTKQSGPAAANGRTRAYSGSDLPSSSSGGANGTAGGDGGARAVAAGRFPAQMPSAHQPSASGGAAAAPAAPRSRSLRGAVGSVASGARAGSPPSASGTAAAALTAGRTRCTAALKTASAARTGRSPLAAHVWRYGPLSARRHSVLPRLHVGRGRRLFLPFSFSPSAGAQGAAGPARAVSILGRNPRHLTPAVPLPRRRVVLFLNIVSTLISAAPQ